MKKLKGRLWYLWWGNKPWKLMTDGGETDLWPLMENIFISLSGKRVSHKRELESYILFLDPDSGSQLEYEPNKSLVLKAIEGFGWTNISAYLDEVLIWLDGRMVEIEIGDDGLKICADKTEEVFGLYFTDGNSCKIPQNAENTICKIGQGKETCIFVSLSQDGFYCEKFSSMTARVLLDRLAKGTLNAGRIGNCALLGRKEELVTT
ncbi:MAG: hypothetical protein WC587_03100 [Candidatus Paceibacterota bacterium]